MSSGRWNGPPRQKLESAVEPVERGQIHAGEVVEQICSEDERPAGSDDVRLFVDDDRNDPLQHLTARNDDGTTRRADQNIGAHAARAAGLLIQHSVA